MLFIYTSDPVSMKIQSANSEGKIQSIHKPCLEKKDVYCEKIKPTVMFYMFGQPKQK